MTDSVDASINSDTGISLATMTAGMIAALVFLLISSLLFNESSWPMTSDRVWTAKTLTGEEIARTNTVMQSGVQTEATVRAQSQEQEGHFLDALYRTEFMRIFTKPT